MNAPDEQAHIVLAPGLEKVVYNADTKVPNTGTFTIRNFGFHEQRPFQPPRTACPRPDFRAGAAEGGVGGGRFCAARGRAGDRGRQLRLSPLAHARGPSRRGRARGGVRRGRKQRAPATISVPSEAPSVVVMVPQNEKIRGNSGCWRGTRGAAPGPRRGRGAECPRAGRGTFCAPVVGGNAPEKRLGADRAA